MSTKAFTYEGKEAGPRFLVLGSVHGDEPCGTGGIERVQKKLDSGELQITQGTLILVPRANPNAYEQNLRQTEENLNRVFRKTEKPTSYEAQLANELCALADTADVMLDLHSSSAPGPVNIFVDYPSEKTTSLADAIGPTVYIFDWPKVYAEDTNGLQSFTTERYMHDIGKYAVTLECGQHVQSEAVDVAEQSILRALKHLEMIEDEIDVTPMTNPRKVYMTHLFVKEEEGDRLIGTWEHLQTIPAGTCIAERADGEKISVDTESVMIFPTTAASKKEEWFYLAKEN